MNRRKFIQSFGVAGATLFVSLKANSAYTIFNADAQITGTIRAAGKGLANVVVSDGYSVVKTDAKGNYAIATHKLAKFVWVSTPAGFEFKTDANVAKQYQNVERDAVINFDLTALKVKDTKHNFIVWADPQVKNMKDVALMMTESVPATIKTIKAMDPKIPVHGITVGDIVWDNLALFKEYNKAVEQMGIPFFQCLGNHDMDYRQGGDETSDRTFMEHYGPTYYSFNRGKAHYIVLDDVRYLGEERKYDGFIQQHQLDWMAKDLAFVPKDALVIVCLHIPIESGVKNKEDFYKVLAGFRNVHVMSGHTHFNENTITGNVYEHNHGTVCGAWWTGPICEDGTPSGYGVYEVDGTRLKWYYQGTGLDRKEQLRLYVDELTNQKRLIANVWNWDPAWKVTYFLDGKAMGTMQQEKGYDPLSVKTMKGDQLPKGRTFPEPKLNEHIFVARFAPSVSKVKVVVTDRFGEQFSAEA